MVGLAGIGLILWDVPQEKENFGAYTEQQVIDYINQYEAGEITANKRYTQLLENGNTADGAVQIPNNIKRNLPPYMEVHVYDGGYQIIFKRLVTQAATSSVQYNATQTKSVGYGWDAATRTWDWK